MNVGVYKNHLFAVKFNIFFLPHLEVAIQAVCAQDILRSFHLVIAGGYRFLDPLQFSLPAGVTWRVKVLTV